MNEKNLLARIERLETQLSATNRLVVKLANQVTALRSLAFASMTLLTPKQMEDVLEKYDIFLDQQIQDLPPAFQHRDILEEIPGALRDGLKKLRGD